MKKGFLFQFEAEQVLKRELQVCWSQALLMRRLSVVELEERFEKALHKWSLFCGENRESPGIELLQ